ncbi:capsule biosynthesis protein [Gymnodinialimonas ulvae]|uniref:capsule biosynthesis protein n=1 Tax=Gymnodinialimonas ulvae TaxID=3126504 RepID=UPI003098C998
MVHSHSHRTFLFLQGPHGPFFHGLAQMLRAAGGTVWRVGFNRGDQAFWPDRASYIPFRDRAEAWDACIARLLDEKAITDLVLYGDTRPVHARAIAQAKARGLTVHVFEEGYLRPYWVSYERGGANGHSRLMQTSVDQMRVALADHDRDLPDAPARWGDMRQHVFYGAVYHGFVLLANRAYAHFRPHRALSVRDEFLLYLRRLALMPLFWLDRVLATYRIKTGGFPYHLALLQLAHDASFRDHGPFDSMAEFLDAVIAGFADGAPPHHHLVFKAHPLEDGRTPMRADIRRIARAHAVEERVHYLRGGKLARLLDDARSAVTVNSTAAQQALWRGLPLKAVGQAVYLKPEFVSDQPMAAFFQDPTRPDSRAYRDYRRYLLETSQIAGSFYSLKGRRQLLRQVVDIMLSADDPYDALDAGRPAPRQHLSVVR